MHKEHFKTILHSLIVSIVTLVLLHVLSSFGTSFFYELIKPGLPVPKICNFAILIPTSDFEKNQQDSEVLLFADCFTLLV